MSQEETDKIAELSAHLQTLLASNSTILDLLRGNPHDPSTGLLTKIKKMEAAQEALDAKIDAKHNETALRISKIEKFKDRTIWILYGAGAATGWTLTGALGKLFSLITKH